MQAENTFPIAEFGPHDTVPEPVVKRGLLKNGVLGAAFHSIGGRVVFTALNVITGLLTARALHPQGRGELAAMGVWPNFLPNLITLGIPSALIFRLRQTPAQSANLIRAALYLTVLLGGVATVAGMVAMPFWLSKYSVHTVHLAQFFMLNSVVVLLIAMLRGLRESHSDFFASGMSFALTPVITLVGLLGLIGAHHLTPGKAAFTYIVGGLPTVVFLFVRSWPELRAPARSFLASSRLLLSYGVRSYGVDLCGTLSLYADQALVVRLLTPTAMGIYVVALSLSRMLNIIQASVASILFPRAINLNETDLLELTGRAARVSTTISLVGGAAIALAGPFVLSLLYGAEYRAAGGVLDLLILEAIATGCTLVLTQAYMAMGRPGTVTVLQSSGIVLSIPLLLLLIPRFGIFGASLALLCASLIRLVLTVMSFRFYVHLPTPNLMPSVEDFRPIADALRKRSAAVLP